MCIYIDKHTHTHTHTHTHMCSVSSVLADSCDPMDCSLPGSSVHGIFLARILEWVALPSSRGSSPSRDQPASPALEADSLLLSHWESLYLYTHKLPWWLRRECICLQCGRPGFDPWVGKIPWRRKWQPTPGLLPGKSHGQRSLVGYSPWGRKESDTTE